MFKSLYLPDVIKWDEESLTDTYGRLEIVPLERGFGRTIGNALRRVMLSSLEGYAPVSLAIDGVKHEFSTVPGVREDVPEIVLNVKSVIVDLQGGEKGILRLDVKGTGTYTAGHLKGDDFVRIVNESQELANLDANGELSMEIVFEKGKGFIPADEWILHGKKDKIGVILLDSWFCPVKKVNFQVQSARVGDRTDYDHLIMDVTTDGSISPEKAVSEACEILIEHFRMIPGGLEPAPGEPEIPAKKEDTSDEEDILSLALEDAGIPKRIANVLSESGIETLEELTARSTKELLSLSGFGPSSLDVIKDVLEEKGLKLQD